jgi:WXXGXW repeat (2 copies)
MKNLLRISLVLACLFLGGPRLFAQFTVGIGVTIRTPPPVLPVYAQPPCPVEGYLWTPGYWAYGELGYYWVPGVWLAPPAVGMLWTPGYWGYSGGLYGWHAGYWGPHIGFYGGVNYGFGYGGVGFVGGMWQGGSFHYNTAVMHVNTTVVHNTYINRTVIHNTTVVNNNSFNGPGGTTARPSAQELTAMNERHLQPTPEQFSHNETMRQDRHQLASVNRGHPTTMAMNSVNGRRFNQQGNLAQGASHPYPYQHNPNIHNQPSPNNHLASNTPHNSYNHPQGGQMHPSSGGNHRNQR